MRVKFLVATALALVLAAVGLNLHGQGGKTVRQAWEYKALVGVFPITGATTLHEDGSPIRGTSPLSRARELGDEGWELVSVAGTVLRDTTQFLYWFKRPK